MREAASGLYIRTYVVGLKFEFTSYMCVQRFTEIKRIYFYFNHQTGSFVLIPQLFGTRVYNMM